MKNKTMLTTLVLLPLAATPAAAADNIVQETAPGVPTTSPPQIDRSNLIWSEDLKDSDVLTVNGEDAGEIEGVLLERDQNRVAYVMVEIGGFLGIGERMVAVPWAALYAGPRRNTYVVNVTEDVLKAAPSAKSENFDEVADANWQQSVDAYWSQRAGLFEGREPMPQPASRPEPSPQQR